MGKVIKTIAASLSLSLMIFGLGCGSGLTGPPAPSISQVTPQTIPAGSQAQTLKVTGANFTSSAVILWNGSPLITSLVNSTTLTGTIGSGDLTTPSTAKLQVQNQETMAESQTLPVVVSATATGNSLTPLAITATSLPQATVGTAYSATLSATGGTSPYIWSLVSGNIPAGLNLSTNTGILSGTPTTSGSYSFVLSVTDSSSPTQSMTATITLSIAAATPTVPATPPLTITSSALPTGTSGSSYSGLLQASGGSAPYLWSITGGLPTGLSLVGTSGLISGTPTASGTFPITVTVRDSSSTPQTATVSLSLSIVAAGTPLSITSATLPAATATQPYSATLNAAGGTAPYTWSGTLPTGLTLASNGSITGTPTASGTSLFNVTVTDSSSPAQTVHGAISLVVAPTQLTITSATLASGTIGSNYSQALQAAGGTAPYAWSVSSGSLPAGLSLATSGSVLGTPTATGTFNFTATVTDASSPAQSKSVAVSLTIAPAALAITSSNLPSGTVGAGYSVALQATGGTNPYSWSIIQGSLPGGLIFVSSTGIVSGTPTASGTFNFTASVTDASNPAQSKSVAVSLAIAPATLAITSSTLPNGTNGTGYSNALEASGGTAPYTWSVTTGSLPAGLNLGATTGVVSGAPTASGTFSFTATVSDAGSPAQSKSAAVSLTIAPAPLAILTSTLPSGTQGSSYSGTLRTNGGTAPFTWSITGGSLAAGLNLGATTGVISGTPTASGNFSVTVMVKDSAATAQTATATLSLSVVAAGSPLAITSGTLHSGTTNTPYSASLNATGGTAPYTWSITGGSLPSAFTLASNGTISGTPTTSGTISFTGTATDSSSPAQTQSAPISFVIAPPALAILTSSLPSGTQGSAYSSGIQATGGNTPYSWSITSGTLPAGLSLGTATGIVSGTPTASGTFSVTATVTDTETPAQTKSVSLSIVITPPALAITTPSFAPGTQGTAYSASLLATGGTAPYAWSISTGSLPAGLSLSASTGLISGTPTANGTFSFTATVTDAENPAQSKSALVSLVVAPAALVINSPSTLPSGTQGVAYSNALTASGGTTPYSWSISAGSLPAGTSLNASTGTISGTPTSSGTFNITVTVTDASNPTQTKSAGVSLVIAPPALAITTTSVPSGTQGTTYSTALLATGGTTPYGWSITSGTLPAGLNLSATTGLVSGTPTANGTFHITATVADASNPAQSKSVALSLVIAPPALLLTTTSLPSGTQNTSYSKTLTATGGTAPYSWSTGSGSLPAGLSLSATTGIISGTPTASGSFSISLVVKDSSSPQQAATATLSLSIAAATPALTITTGTLVSGTDGTAYSATMSATGGTPAYTWSITSGSLPAGLTLAATTGVISGTPTATGTASFTAKVTDNGSPAQTQSASASITIAAAQQSGPGTTWYIRPDGGTRYSANATAGQCDGKADVAYSGTGTNQRCAFKDPRYLWDDQSYGNDAWVIAGGDTVILRGGPWRIGFDAAPGSCSGAGCGAGYTWCFGGGGNYGCYNPTIPAGTASQHTRILGENYASCNSGGVTNRSQLTQIFGGFGVTEALNLTGAKYVDVECLEVTRHSQCIAFGSPAIPASCVSGSSDDYDSDGVHTDNTTHDLLMQDLWIHGHIGRGIKGPIGGLVTCLRCDIAYNGAAGWDFDDGNATPIVNGNWQFLYSTIEWSGCNQEYPAVHAIPVASCYSQSTGGYGDGVGTPHGTGLSATIDHSKFIYNTQDGLDLGHVDTGGPYTLSITNSIAYSNNGGTFKIGGNFGSTVLTNNVAIGDCIRMAYPITGTPSTYNANLADFCRAEDTLPFDFRQNSTITIANNTIVTYSPTIFDISCWDAPGVQGANNNGCGGATLNFYDNIVVGYDNPATYNLGGQQGGPGVWYFQEPAPNGSTSGTVIGTINRGNNLYYGIGHGFTCPTGYANEKCVTPDFINQPTGTGTTFAQSELDNFNFNISSGSAAAGTGITYTGVPATDYNGVNRPNPPSMGAVEP